MDGFKEKMMLRKDRKKLDNQKKVTKMNIGKNKKKSHKIEIIIKSESSSQSSRDSSPVNKYFKGPPRHIPPNTDMFLKEIKKNKNVHRNKRTWNKKILAICALIFLISYNAYILLRKNVLLPSVSTIYRYLDSDFELIDSENIVNIENIDSILDSYRKTNNIDENEEIPGFIAVDAVALTRHVTITEDGNIIGLTKKVKLTPEEIENLRVVIENQEKLLKKLNDLTITNAFIFYFQPINPIYKCMTLNIQGTHSGKATNDQSSMLPILKEKVEKKKYKVIGYASDGDSGYWTYRDKNIDQWNQLKRPILSQKTVLFSNDPLHLLKRARYRLLSHNLVQLFKYEDPISVELIHELTNLPSVIFDNSQLTKMHDHLPIQLFTIESLEVLMYAELYAEASYFLPFVLLNEALSTKNLTVDERVDFLEIITFYCKYYKMLYEKTSKTDRANLIGKNKTVLFDLNLIDDLMTTTLSINTVLNGNYDIISLNRIGTNPLEHHFGLIQLRCKFKHDFKKFIEEEAKIIIIDEIEKMTIGNLVHHRKSSYGENVVLDEDPPHGEKSKFFNSEMALSILWKFGLPTNKIKKVSNCFNEEAYLEFISKTKNVKSFHKAKNRQTIINSLDLSIGHSSGAYIKQRLEEKQLIPDE